MDWRAYAFPIVPRRRIVGLAFGDMPSTRRGYGSEQIGDRLYEYGDDPRDIDWAATAKASSVAGSTELIVRENEADESVPTFLFVDRRPSIALSPPSSLPWRQEVLDKRRAAIAAGSMIAESAAQQHCYIGYLDYADALHPFPEKRAEVPFFRPPNNETEVWRIQERYLPYEGFFAPESNLAEGFRFLLEMGNEVPSDTILFVLSDFLALPTQEAFAALRERFDVVPLVLQDPIFEQSFPDFRGMTVATADLDIRRVVPVRFRPRDVREQRARHEARFRSLIESFARLELDPVVIGAENADAVHAALCDWADRRRLGRR